MTIELQPEEEEEKKQEKSWRKRLPGRRNNKHNGPEVRNQEEKGSVSRILKYSEQRRE